MSRRSGPGFFALDRAAMRLARREINGRTFSFFVILAADCAGGVFNNGSSKDIATDFDYSVRSVERMLGELAAVGWIEWSKPTNQHADGHVRILRDLERHKGGASTPVATASADRETAGSRVSASGGASAVPRAVPPQCLPQSCGGQPGETRTTRNQEPEPPPNPPHIAESSALAPAESAGKEKVNRILDEAVEVLVRNREHNGRRSTTTSIATIIVAGTGSWRTSWPISPGDRTMRRR